MQIQYETIMHETISSYKVSVVYSSNIYWYISIYIHVSIYQYLYLYLYLSIYIYIYIYIYKLYEKCILYMKYIWYMIFDIFYIYCIASYIIFYFFKNVHATRFFKSTRLIVPLLANYVNPEDGIWPTYI